MIFYLIAAGGISSGMVGGSASGTTTAHKRMIERRLMKCIPSFKVCMMRIDQILDDVDGAND